MPGILLRCRTDHRSAALGTTTGKETVRAH
ncbi:hypothetical protein J2Z21_009834 [Streptomyces griseochromogenes]|uniref:Uncharacterized protein n=1 Tax=Streptomyces griseochromogenes TaxID=68214 RepID=A0ABS4MAV9_9ACTN|nr:hypothetical protein [Streptomyces griseochromogenes]